MLELISSKYIQVFFYCQLKFIRKVILYTVKINIFPITDFCTPLFVMTPSFLDMNASN